MIGVVPSGGYGPRFGTLVAGGIGPGYDDVVTGTASGSIGAITGTAQGQRTVLASVSGSVSVSGEATGRKTTFASASGVVDITGTVAGTRGSLGSGAGVVDGIVGAASPVRIRTASGSGSVQAITGAADGKRVKTGSAAGHVGTFTASAAGFRVSAGAGTGHVGTFTASGIGRRLVNAEAQGTVLVAGVGSGVRLRGGTAFGKLSVSGRYVEPSFVYTPPTLQTRRPGKTAGRDAWLSPAAGIGVTVLRIDSSYVATSTPTKAQLESAEAVYAGGREHVVYRSVKEQIEESGVGGDFVLSVS